MESRGILEFVVKFMMEGTTGKEFQTRKTSSRKVFLIVVVFHVFVIF